MFERVKHFVREVRISVNFPQYEKTRLQAHIAEAARRFDTAQLEKEAATIKASACLAANQKYGASIIAVKKEVSSLEEYIGNNRETLALFERNYTLELNQLYEQKKALFEEKREIIGEMKSLQGERSLARESLEDAYDRLELAKKEIDSWYGKSERTPWLFGSGGKKLPKHSPFDQSFGDLEGYKKERGDAVSDIGANKAEVSDIQRRQNSNKKRREENKFAITMILDQISATRIARQKMYGLKQQGISASVLKQELSKYVARQIELKERLAVLDAQRDAFVEEMECRSGVRERDAKIHEIRSQKVQFLKAFDSPHNRQSLRADHRIKWMLEHGVNT